MMTATATEKINAELLACLRQTVGQYRAFVDQCCKGDDNRFHEASIARAVAAIHKAEGRQA